MNEERLKELNEIEVKQSKIDADFEGILKKQSVKATFNWQIPTTILGVILIFCLILVTGPLTQSPITATGEGEIKSVSYANADLEPTSKWLAGVRTIRNDAELEKIQTYFNEAFIVPNTLHDAADHWYNVRIKFKNGETEIYEYYWGEKVEFLYAQSTGTVYQLSTERVELLWLFDGDSLTKDRTKFISLFVIICLFAFGKWRIDINMMKETGLNKKPPLHSSIWQTISYFGIGVSLPFILFALQQLHVVLLIALTMLNYIICLTIERKGENNEWRKKLLLVDFIYLTCFMYVLFFV